MQITRAIRLVSPTLPEKKLGEILDETGAFVHGKHLLYPADTNGPHAHLPSFFYFSRWGSHPEGISLIVDDLATWIKDHQVSFDLILAPGEPSVMKVVKYLSEEMGKPAAFLEYLPSGRFGEKIEPAGALRSGKRVLAFNGVSATGRCVGERLPGFAQQAGAQIAAIAAFVKGCGKGVKSAEAKYGANFYSAIQADIPIYPPDDCPLCQDGIPLANWNAGL